MAQDTKDLFQQVVGRLTELPGAEAVVHGLNNVRDRLDDTQKRLRGLDAIERRVSALERRLDELTKDQKPPRGRATKASAGPKATKKASAGSKRTASALKRSAGTSSRPRSSRTRRESGNA